MPFFDEAISPRYNPNREVDPAVQPWLKKMASFDAYIFVTPEYNHSIPAVLKNAFDYLTWELKRKPAAIVSHGSAGGARAAMHLKEVLSEGQAVPIPNFVALTHMSDIISDDGQLDETVKANPYGPHGQLRSLLAELQWYSDALTAAREAKEPAFA
jgi:NAD(P)H-dependent FMN reductase